MTICSSSLDYLWSDFQIEVQSTSMSLFYYHLLTWSHALFEFLGANLVAWKLQPWLLAEACCFPWPIYIYHSLVILIFMIWLLLNGSRCNLSKKLNGGWCFFYNFMVMSSISDLSCWLLCPDLLEKLSWRWLSDGHLWFRSVCSLLLKTYETPIHQNMRS